MKNIMTVKEFRKYLKEDASIMIIDDDEPTVHGCLSFAHLLNAVGAEDEFGDFTVVELKSCRYGLIIHCRKENNK